jgi:hypothetical protein
LGPQSSPGKTNGLAVRLAVRIVAVLALLAGGVFFFQGIGVLPGSFMTGRSEWAFIGAALAGGGLVLLWLASGFGGQADR